MHTFFHRILPFALLALLLSAAPLSAQRIGSHDATPAQRTSITISPLHLILPMLEVTGEFRMTDDVGMAGIVGVGSVLGNTTFELGSQGNYYLIGDFEHGMQLGAELMYTHVSGDISDQDVSASFTGSGLTFGPYVGYKVAADFGLTFNLQAGMLLGLIRASAENSTGQTGSASDAAAFPLLNLNLGWSF